MLKDSDVILQCSSQKYGKAAFCELKYTQSKIADNILFRQLACLKLQKPLKIDYLTIQALNQLWRDKSQNLRQDKDIQISTLKHQLEICRKNNRQLTDKNLKRVKYLVDKHTEERQIVIRQREEEAKFNQSQIQGLEGRIWELQKQLKDKQNIVECVEKQKGQLQHQRQRFDIKVKEQDEKVAQEKQYFETKEKQYLERIRHLNEQKLQIQLSNKKSMLQNNQANRDELKQIEEYYKEKIQLIQAANLKESIKSKQSLNRVLRENQIKSKELKDVIYAHQSQIKMLKSDIQIKIEQIQRCQVTIDQKEDALVRYDKYLDDSDESIRNLKQLLIESKDQLQRAKASMERNEMDRTSVLNRMKICEDEAKMWKQSYYLSKSRSQQQESRY